MPHTYRGKKVFYPKCVSYFTKAREGLEKYLETQPRHYGLGWKISQFGYEGEMK